MKMFTTLVVFVVLASANLFGQKIEKFDVISFQTPKGWQKEVSQNAIQFGAENADGGICMISLFKPLPGGPNPKINFEAAWESIVQEMVKAKSDPQMQESVRANGWVVESGYAQYESDGKMGVVLLATATGESKMVNIIILTNTDAFQQSIDDFMDSLVFPNIEKKVETVVKNNAPVSRSDGFAFSTTNFDDGWNSTIHDAWVLVIKGDLEVYLCYALPFDSNKFSGTGLRERDYYWDNFVSKFFTIQTKQYRDDGEFISSSQPDYVEGWATDKQTGKKRFIAMRLSISPNTAYITIASATNEAAIRQQFPNANGKYTNDLATMSSYNKFAIEPNDIIGRWENGNTSTAQWYYVSPPGYEGYAGMTVAATSAVFNFASSGNYTSINNGATGSVGSMNTFQQNYKGKYTLTNWNLTATNRWQGKSESFEAWFEIIRGGRILRLKTPGNDYSLVKAR